MRQVLPWVVMATFLDATEPGLADVNEGELHFLPRPPTEPVHHLYNRITISNASLSGGWVQLEQSHEHLDSVPRAQLVNGKGWVRDLRVVSESGIGQAWTEGSSVQLRDIHPAATISIHAESRALAKNGDMSFNLSNGPSIRKCGIPRRRPLNCIGLDHAFAWQ